MTRDRYQPFHALSVPLKDSNLIEASAGTGKTYSIAILVLRLVLQGMPIRNILMVTFTKAAVAELEARVRLFVRAAYKHSTGKDIRDDNIKKLVAAAIADASEQEVQQRLRDAVLLLDETSVLTIHSFCQQTLTEFAFETNQLFGMDMMSDASAILEEAVNEFWRRHVATLPCEVLELLSPGGLRDTLVSILKEHLGGKRYALFEGGKDYTLTDDFLKDFLHPFQEKGKAAKEGKAALLQWLKENKALLDERCAGNKFAMNNFGDITGNPKKFLETIQANATKAYVQKCFGEVLQQLAGYEVHETDCATLMETVREQLQCLAIQQVGQYIQLLKQRQHLMSFDDLISNLHQAFDAGRNTRLIEALRNKYTAVFVDEFQDTDKLQYEIFNQAFGSGDTVLFYIGDPKQSIYAWRKADIFTYFQARDSVKNLYSMNCNYRSTPAMIAAMNHFFLPREDFDTFYFQNNEQAIRYFHVAHPGGQQNQSSGVRTDQQPEAALTIFPCPANDKITEATAAQTLRLLREGQISGKEERLVRPSDIGILVRNGKQGKEIKAVLAKKGIPATMVDDAKILHAAEAVHLLHVLQAMAQPVRGDINRALLSPFTGFTAAQVAALADEVILSAFTRYRESWLNHGCYTAVMRFLNDFGVQERLLHAENGERTLTNLHQLTELLHTTQIRKSLSLTEAIAWLKRGIEGANNEGDAFELRIESDEEAVRIVTIHKSKGLEYPIVLAPFLDFVPRKKDDFISFRDPGTSDYVCLEKSKASEAQLNWYAEQSEQENRRLMYVAITRAVYQCYIFKSRHYKSSTLDQFLNAMGSELPPSVCYENEAPEMPAGSYRSATKPAEMPLRKVPDFQQRLQQPHWGILSFTYLNARGNSVSRPKPTEHTVAYEQFIFSELHRGARTGDLLHYILERIHFNDDSRWEEVIENALRRYVPHRLEVWTPMLCQLLEQVLYTPLEVCGATFPLSEVPFRQRLPEFEFYFPVRSFSTEALQALGADTPLQLKDFQHPLEGVMNGKLDLFFEHKNRYYILDWKSNYLGSSPEDYNREALSEVMATEGYHLQYHLYTLAAVRYLKTRLPGFDYERDFGGVIYLFLRGMRAGSQHGVYCCKPELEKLEKMEGVFGGKRASVEERAMVKEEIGI